MLTSNFVGRSHSTGKLCWFRLYHEPNREEITQTRLSIQYHLCWYVLSFPPTSVFGVIDTNFCIGQTGLGKSTLINTIFAAHLIDSKGRLTVNEPVRQTTEIQAVSHGKLPLFPFYFFQQSFWCLLVIEEKGVRLRLNIVDTPGYGDQINNDRWYSRRSEILTDFI